MIQSSKYIALPLLLFFLLACTSTSRNISSKRIDAYSYAPVKTVTAQNGVVVSAHPLASKVGLEILKMGGNAMDAAIATQLALAVVFPGAGNLGGGGFTVARLKDGKLIAIDYREKAPLLGHRDMYLDAGGNAMPDKSLEGHLASGVPGTISGLFESHKYAKLPFEKLIEPAILLAQNGFAISEKEASNLNKLRDKFRLFNTVMPVFVKPGLWKEGDTLVQTDLANTLKRIRENGAPGFYEGETARLITEEMKRGQGIISLEDLRNYKAKEREPHVFQYKGYTIVGMPMPSSGGLLVNQMMKMIEKRNLGSMGFHSVRAVQLMTEVERIAFADRGKYMGDMDFYKVPVNVLVSEKYLTDRMKEYDSSVAGNSAKLNAGDVSKYESEETTHLGVIDKEGNAVAVTTTLNGAYGSKTVVGGAGFLLNNEMDDFSIKPGFPNMYGAIGGDANAIEPGKRMLSSMSPTIVLKDMQPYLVIGTPGGTTIPTSVFQTLVNILEFNLSTEDAVNLPKFHHQWLPDTLFLEKGFPVKIEDSLSRMGYKVKERSSIGRTEVIQVLGNGKFKGVADWRGDDSAEGY